MTEAEIKARCDAVARTMLDTMSKGCDGIPFSVAIVIPFGVAAALAFGSKVPRQAAIDMLNGAWDDIEGGQP